MKALVIAEGDNNSIKRASLACITAARQLADQIDVLLINADDEQAKQATQLEHVNHVDHYPLPLLAQQVDAIVLQRYRDFPYILSAATTNGKQWIPRIAAKLDVSPLSDITAVIDESTFQRRIYAGNAVISVKSLDATKVMTVRSTAFSPATTDPTKCASLNTLTAIDSDPRVKSLGTTSTPSERPALSAANIIVSGGRAFSNSQQFNDVLHPLATQLQAAIGASRAAVDAGFMSNDYQIGQTGKVVAPQVYFAIGISGAIQHLAGMLDSQLIIAINKDPNANIHRVADYSLVGDLFTIVPELTAKLRG